MKKYSVVILILIVMAIFSACASEAMTQGSSGADFSVTDFSGKWCVSEMRFPGGKPLDASEMQLMGSGITLELLDNGVYFVYGPDGAALGQGQYSVAGGVLTCTAGEQQTVYQIVDENTLRSVSDDNSVTVMSKQPEPSPSITGEDSPDGDIIDGEADQDIPEDGDIIDGEADQDLPEDGDLPPEGTSATEDKGSAPEPSNQGNAD